jgi:hypothetical protein
LSSMFFQGKEMQCSIHDAFVVKYEADAGQRCLPLHTDESTHSLTVALNANTDYEGGGTYFHALKSAARPNQGQVLAFDGSLLHAGDSVLTGTRYIVAAFLLLASMDEPIAQEWMDLFDTDVEKQCSVSKKPRLEVEKSCSDSGSFDFCL